VYTLGSILRVSVSNAASKIMFNDLPSVDSILDMCHVRGCLHVAVATSGII